MRRLADMDSGCGAKLSSLADRLEGLKAELTSLELVPYARPRASGSEKGVACKNMGTSAAVALQVKSDRIGLPATPTQFDPVPFLSSLSQLAYLRPDLMIDPNDECEKLHVRSFVCWSEFLKLIRRWDQLGRLALHPASSTSALDLAEIFGVAKDAEEDRQIIDRRRRNQREMEVLSGAAGMGHPVLLTQLWLKEHEVGVGFLEDLEHMFHGFDNISEQRSISTPVGRASSQGGRGPLGFERRPWSAQGGVAPTVLERNRAR